jgi:hypothetical protein
MRHPWSIPVLLALGALGGYTAGAQPLGAQPEVLPFRTGQTVELGFDASNGRRCLIEEMRGTFVRCRNPSRSDRAGRWLNVNQIEWVTTSPLAADGTLDQERR